MQQKRLFNRREFIGMMALSAAALSTGSLSGCAAFEDELAGTHCVVDDVGREVTIPLPRTLHHIYFTSPLAQIFCFTLAPDLLGGTTIHFLEEQLDYLPDGTSQLPYLGTLASGGTIDVDALKYMDVQLIFSISGIDLTDVNVDDAVELQEQSGIPVVLIDGSFDLIGESYRFLGECLGRRERADQLASYCSDVLDRVTRAVAQVPQAERVTYYFAEGQEGLSTESDASQHSRAFVVAGGVNVAADLEYVAGSMAMVETSLEQVRQWDPQFIIAWDMETRYGASKLITNSTEWADIDAVRNGRVFEMPYLPFPFCDRPPGMNRFLGIQWLANLFYPDYYDVDMVDVVREFYSRCYWRDITVEQARSILGTSYEYLRDRV